jgi:HEAT repeat protein
MSDHPGPTTPPAAGSKATVSDVEFFAAWAHTLDLLGARLAGMTFTPDSLSIDESDLARFGAQAGRALLEVVVRAGSGLAQPTMTGTLEHTPDGINIAMKPDDPKLYLQWVERVPPPFLSVICCWGSNFRGLTPELRDADRLREFWSWGGMVVLAAHFPERFASVNPGVRDFPPCEPTGCTDDGKRTFTSQTDRISLAERAAWRTSQARDWAEACRAVAAAIRKLGEANEMAKVSPEPSLISPVPSRLSISTDACDRILVVEDESDETYLRWWMEKILPKEQWERFSTGMVVLPTNGRPTGDTMNHKLDAIAQTRPDAQRTQPKAFVLADRDYRLDEEIQTERDRLAKHAFARQIWHVWRECIEIENYLICPSAIVRHIMDLTKLAATDSRFPPPSETQVRALVDQAIEESREKARNQLVDTFARVKRAQALSTCVVEAEQFLAGAWQGDGRIQWCDAKEIVLPHLRKACKEQWNVAISDRELIRSLRAEEIPPEIAQTVGEIASFLSESYHLGLRTSERTAVQPLVEGLRSKDPGLRRSAAEALGTKGRAALPALSKALSDGDVIVRREVAWSFVRIGTLAQPATPALLAALSDNDREVREHAATALGQIGRPARAAIPTLVNMLRSDEEFGARQHAASALGNIGEAGEALPALITALTDPDINVRIVAAEALGKLGSAAAPAASQLLLVLKDMQTGREGVRQQAAFALGKIGMATPNIISALCEARNDPHRDPRRFAVRALGDLGPDAESAAIEVANALDDDEANVREDAAEALGKICRRATQIVPNLVRKLEDENCPVRYKAAEALGRFGADAIEAIPELEKQSLAGATGLVRVKAAIAMMRIRGKPEISIPILAAHLSDSDNTACIAAAEALRTMGPDALTVVPALAEALAVGHWSVRAAIAETLGELGDAAASAVPALVEAFASDHSVETFVGEITWGEGPVYDLVRYRAAEALGKMGPAAKNALPALRDNSKYQQVVRAAAEDAIRRIE